MIRINPKFSIIKASDFNRNHDTLKIEFKQHNTSLKLKDALHDITGKKSHLKLVYSNFK